MEKTVKKGESRSSQVKAEMGEKRKKAKEEKIVLGEIK